MKSHALCIGINNYPGTDLDLQGCVNDAEDLAGLFQRSCSSVHVLLDKKATRKGIAAAVGELLGKLNRGDWGFVTFSGHGTWIPDEDGDEPDGRDECLVPHDVDNLIRDDEIHGWLQDRPPGTRLFLLSDSCHSGTVYRMFKREGARPRLKFIPPDQLLHNTPAKERAREIAGRIRVFKRRISPGIVHFAGCRDAEYSFDAEFDGRPNGAFTRHVIDALPRLKKPTFANWMAAVRCQLPSYDYPQTPALNARAAEKRWLIPWME